MQAQLASCFGASLLLTLPWFQGDHGNPPPEDPTAPRVDTLIELVHSSPATWGPRLDDARAEVERDPRGALEYLVSQLPLADPVEALPLESQTYTVCGNTLTLLERLTDERICGCGKDWIGFTSHDHRSAQPDPQTIQYPWEAWLHARRDTPVEQWFWGLSYGEFTVLSKLMRQPESNWSPDEIEKVEALGSRAFPYLLDKLVDQEFACSERLYCSQANAMLQQLTGVDLGPLPQTALLHLSASDPERAQRTVIHKNKSARDHMQRRWAVALLQR